MGMVSVITISAVNYSVYALTSDPVADANNYFAARLGAASWTAATTLQKQQGLISAARMLDRRADFSGEEVSASQPLEWPRNGASNCGVAVPDNTVPDDIVLAEFELALSLLQDATIQNSPNTGSNVESVKAGSAAVSFFVPTILSGTATMFPQAVMELVGCYLAGAGAASLLAPFVDGTNPDCCNEQSHFGDCGGGTGTGLTRGL